MSVHAGKQCKASATRSAATVLKPVCVECWISGSRPSSSGGPGYDTQNCASAVRCVMDPVSVPADTMALAGRLALATLLGAVVGIDREIALKPAGLRTHALVSLGAALVTVVGLQLGHSGGDTGAPGRIIQGLVAGIGFIGGGVILHREGGRAVHGLTTAASIWIASVTGVAVGTGLWRGAVAAVVLSLVVLALGRFRDNALRRGGTGDNPDDN